MQSLKNIKTYLIENIRQLDNYFIRIKDFKRNIYKKNKIIEFFISIYIVIITIFLQLYEHNQYH